MDGTLDEVLQDMAQAWGFNSDDLIRYANEDGFGGHNPTPKDNHPAPEGSFANNKGIWEVEGKTLYALVRALKPQNVLEIGNQWFCSTAHIAEALLKNGRGHLWTIDIENESIVREEHRGVVTQVIADLFYFDYAKITPIDFIFEDSYHTPDMVHYVWSKFLKYGSEGGVIVSHDAEHMRVGVQVQEGLERVGLPYTSYKIEPADCGLAIWRKNKC